MMRLYWKQIWRGLRTLWEYFALSAAFTIIFAPLWFLEYYSKELGRLAIPAGVAYAVFVGTPLFGAFLPPWSKKLRQTVDDQTEKKGNSNKLPQDSSSPLAS